MYIKLNKTQQEMRNQHKKKINKIKGTELWGVYICIPDTLLFKYEEKTAVVLMIIKCNFFINVLIDCSTVYVK